MAKFDFEMRELVQMQEKLRKNKVREGSRASNTRTINARWALEVCRGSWSGWPVGYCAPELHAHVHLRGSARRLIGISWGRLEARNDPFCASY